MAMERRWGMRKTIGVDVVIDNQPDCLLRGRIDNISIGGLYVQTDANNLSKNAQVELVLMLQQENGTSVYRMPAMVVRLTQNGAGLMFDQYDVNAFRALVVLLLALRKTPVSSEIKNQTHALSLSIESGANTASILEGKIGETMEKVAPFLPALQQSSPLAANN